MNENTAENRTIYAALRDVTPCRATVIEVATDREYLLRKYRNVVEITCDSMPTVGERVWIRKGAGCIYPSAVTGRE